MGLAVVVNPMTVVIAVGFSAVVGIFLESIRRGGRQRQTPSTRCKL